MKLLISRNSIRKPLLLLVLSAIVFVILQGTFRTVLSNFPVLLYLDARDSNVHFIKTYFRTAKTFQESGAELNGSRFGHFGFWLPGTATNAIRLDPRGHTGKKLRVNRLCLVGLFSQQCFADQQLFNILIPRKGLQKVLSDRSVLLTIDDFDPHLVLGFKVNQVQQLVSTPGTIGLLVASVMVVLLINLLLGSGKLSNRIEYLATFGKNRFRGRGQLDTALLALTFVILSISVSHLWVAFDTIPVALWTILLLLLVSLAVIPTRKSVVLPDWISGRYTELFGQSRFSLQSLGIVLLAVAPATLLMFHTWHQEFPNLGDHQYHYDSDLIAFSSLSNHLDVYAWSALVVLVGWFAGFLLVGVVTGFLVLLIGMPDLGIEEIFMRYPGAGRIISMPFVSLAEHLNWNNLQNSGRLRNLCAIVTWLLILRPLVMGRWPDRLILPVVLLVFLQNEVVYFFTTSYLDPWSVVFVLLACELLLTRNGEFDYLKACLLLGQGSLFKEFLVFFIPWFWLAGKPWRHSLTGRLEALRFGLAAVLPFLFYFSVRTNIEVGGFNYIGFDALTRLDWYAEILARLEFQFGSGWPAILLVVLGSWIAVLWFARDADLRWKLLCVAGAILSLGMLLALEQGAIAYTAYPRFYLVHFALMASPLLVLFSSRAVLLNNHNAFLWITCSLIVIGNLPRTVEYQRLAMGPDEQRNFTEHYDAPVFLPVRRLINQAVSEGALSGGDSIYINTVTGFNQPYRMMLDVSKLFDVTRGDQRACECKPEYRAVVMPFIFPGGLYHEQPFYRQQLPQPPLLPDRYARLWSEAEANKPACLSALRESCDEVIMTRIGEFVTGAIGISTVENH